jgi:hypothetical protein
MLLLLRSAYVTRSANAVCRSAEVKFNTIKGLEAIRIQPSGLAGPCIENQLSYYNALCHLLAVCLEPAFMCSFKTSSCLILERERTANVG